MPERQTNRLVQGPEWFATTHWSVVLTAKETESPRSREALEKLCAGYWYPLYAYVRRKGYAPHDAQDLTQEFFARLLKGNFLATIEQRKGRFRTFLIVSLEHFLAKEWARANRQKRGGGASVVSLQETDAEGRYLREPVDSASAQFVYERRWAMTLLERAFERLRKECLLAEQQKLFESAQHLLSGDRGDQSYGQLAANLGMTEGAFKVAVHRLRHRYGKLLRMEIAETVASPDEVEAEIRYLFSALKS
ncbi:MAG TPA: sigma factor [Verrucomicrobiae bacterium]|nr:sigma factor [Verrucomicrobiae bacterium]